MRLHKIVNVSALAAIVAAAACATAGARAASYRVEAGKATSHDIVEQGLRMLQRYQYEVQRIDSSSGSDLIIETNWRGRYPLADEISGGVQEARTRLIITGRGRHSPVASGTADVRTITVQVENMVRLADSVTWTRGYLTPMFREYIDGFVRELRTELDSRMRRF